MRIVSLDPSKNATGWACWSPTDEHVASGVWELGSSLTPPGRVYAKLHANLLDLHRMGPIEAIFFEDVVNVIPGAVITNIGSVELACGLKAHIESFGEAMNCRIIRAVNQTTWRRHFLGKMKRGTRKIDLKEMAMERARQLGFRPTKHDQAEAIGILDYACAYLKIDPRWRKDNILLPPLSGAA